MQEIPQQPQPIYQPVPEQKSKKGFPILPILVTLLISAVIFGGGGYYVGQKNNTQTIQQPVYQNEQISPMPILTPTPNVQALNLKTYRNNNFSFEYPNYLPDFKLREQAYGETKPIPEYESVYLDPQQKGGGPGYSVVIRVGGPEQKTSNLPLEQWLINQGLTSGGYGEGFQRKHELRTIIDKQVIYQTGISSGFTTPSEYNLYIPFDNDIYTIHMDIQTNEEGVTKYSPIFDQILSTFKFIN